MLNGGELLSELQTMRDDGFLSDALLRHAVKKIARSDERFDWVGVYLANDDGTELWLHNYVGSPTEHAKIPVGTGVCGTALATGSNILVDDVTQVDNYLACDPDVKSEMVVLIRAGDSVFGQIDIDSEQPAAFTAEDEVLVTGIADKLAEQIAEERR
jgi:GAF domain-containing protein